MKVLLDKSRLHGLSTARLLEIAQSAELCLPEVLFYELLTTHARDRAVQFRKLHALREHLHFTGSVGHLIRVEEQHGRPARIVEDAECAMPTWVFQEALCDAAIPIPDPIAAELRSWQEAVKQRVRMFRQRAVDVPGLFPALRGLKSGQGAEIVADVRAGLIEHSPFVCELLETLSNSRHQAKTTGPAWMAYRMLQAELLWCIDNFHRYGPDDLSEEALAGFENTACDVEYATVACQADFFLTSDVAMSELFRSMRAGIGCGPDIV
jgi:hypothetical protein